MTETNPNSFRNQPDDRGHFGDYGGRYVAETLMPLVLELEREYRKAQADPEFQREFDDLLEHYVGRPSPLYHAERLTRGAGRRAGLVQARRAQSHRRAQDQQLHRPDPAGDPHGQDAHHRGNRGGPARGRHRHRLRTLRPALRDLHGRRGRAAPVAQCLPHEVARRGNRPRDQRARHAEGRDERRAARLGRECARHFLHHRHRRRAAPLPRTGARLPKRDRPRGAAANAGPDRPPARSAGRGDRRRLERARPVPTPSSTIRT